MQERTLGQLLGLTPTRVTTLDGASLPLSADDFTEAIGRTRSDLDFLSRAYQPDLPLADRADLIEDLLDVILPRLRGTVAEAPNT